MRLYFSGADHENSIQNDNLKSLGGYLSSTPIPNERLNGIFSSISTYSIKNKNKQCLAIFLKNENSSSLNSLKIEVLYPKQKKAKFEFAIVQPNENNFIEKIGSIDSEPFNANFFEPETILESAIVKIESAPDLNENIDFLGETIISSGDTKESLIEDILNHFKESNLYSIEKKSEFSLLVTNLSILETNSPLEILDSSGILLNESVSFSGFLDGKFEISNSLESGETLGIWIKRKILPELKKECEYEIEDTKEESVEIVFNWS